MVKCSLASAASLALTTSGRDYGQSAESLNTDAGLARARKKLAHRKRPIILDDDGDIVYDDETLEGRDSFLSLRMQDAREAGIDSVAWYIMWAIAVQGKTPTCY